MMHGNGNRVVAKTKKNDEYHNPFKAVKEIGAYLI